MSLLAQRNLLHDKVRLAVTLTGVVFAVMLIVIEMALFFGFTRSTSSMIDNSEADFWISSANVPYVEVGVPFNKSKFYEVKATPGVAEAVRYLLTGTRWSRPDGSQELIQIVGVDLSSSMGRPWNVVEGSVEDLKLPHGVMVDELYKKQLGVTRLGDMVEIDGHRARVVAFTRGIHAFGPDPFVFTSFENALEYADLREDQTTFVLVKLEPGANLEEVRRNILARVKNVDVFTSSEFAFLTQNYWTLKTGAGIAVLFAAILGVVVGFVVVAQTIYATTMDHLQEFGTLKAMGAPNSYVYKVILRQAAISALVGYGVGIVISVSILHLVEPTGAPVVMNGWIAAGTFFLTLLMCAGAGLISINEVTRLDPAMVFKG
jgi:putative ABC transport system permease protein